MKERIILIAALIVFAAGRTEGQTAGWLPDITQQQNYTMHRSSSREPTGANADFRTVTQGQTLTILDVDGPGMISHLWFTLNDREPYALKRIVLRMYWDGEESPSVETPIGDFFGLGNGIYYTWQSAIMSVGPDKSMNCWFPMPYAKHAKVTITNEGKEALSNLYWNIDYRVDTHPPAPNTLYFHAEYRQAQPNHGWAKDWYENGDPQVNFRRDPDGKDNYEWFEAKGHGQFLGVTMSILQNQDGWWGEGNDMFYIDGATLPTMVGTGSEDYFLGAWGFGQPAAFPFHGYPQVGPEIAGSRTSVYRFHLDSPIPFTKSMRASIEHGHANARSDNYSSVAYWYQGEPHMAFPPLPEMSDRVPTLQFVGGPGNSKEPYVPGSTQPR
jgi:Protein of unknown function (DUF2961)